MPLEALTPDTSWDPDAHADVIAALAGLDEDTRILLWCDDGCVDCRAQLPAFAAALEAAGVRGRVTEYPVERLPEGEKRGPRVEEYGVTLIPTVVIERGGRTLARYEEGPAPIADALAEQLAAVDAG